MLAISRFSNNTYEKLKGVTIDSTVDSVERFPACSPHTPHTPDRASKTRAHQGPVRRRRALVTRWSLYIQRTVQPGDRHQAGVLYVPSTRHPSIQLDPLGNSRFWAVCVAPKPRMVA